MTVIHTNTHTIVEREREQERESKGDRVRDFWRERGGEFKQRFQAEIKRVIQDAGKGKRN